MMPIKKIDIGVVEKNVFCLKENYFFRNLNPKKIWIQLILPKNKLYKRLNTKNESVMSWKI